MMISVCDFLLAGWTQPLSVFHTTCSSHHRTLCSLFNSILPQSPTWHLLEYLLVFVVWNSCFCFLFRLMIDYASWHHFWSVLLANVRLCLWWLLDFASLMYDIVADCSDNVPTRYLVNDSCVLSSKPLVSASALRLEGQVMIKTCVKCSGFQTWLYLTLCACS